jgi:plasmid stabilization system protein ParE
MNRRIIVLPAAEADLNEQYAWFLTEVNEDVADRFLAAFDATARLAFEHPESGWPENSRRRPRPGWPAPGRRAHTAALGRSMTS